MTPKKRHLLDILRDEESRKDSTQGSAQNSSVQRKRALVPSDAAIRPKISFKIVALVFAASVVFLFSYKFAGNSPDVENARYCVVAREFNSQNLELARKLGAKLVSLGYTVKLAQRQVSSTEVDFELYVGDQPSEAALSETLAKLQALTLDGLGGASPFSEARIKPLSKN
jgi:hypothetical protein